ncbi:MAG TPA: serine hydrolase domain-containing protein [Oligoflexus sp.]|uniref:serine hydrolase domain-containing protein n=1 Tax=Oligoflexus sp. TaxID=1971216 RepID=UPI002D7FCC58|nr:serine hydrolase domain-containing protein [Oligoflexus sp.]HET9237363.1 serine hydrolase domain-containing protein [Oligoflexus sp.]
MKFHIFLALFLSFLGYSAELSAQDPLSEIDNYLTQLVKDGKFSGRVFVSMKGVELSRGYGRTRFPDGAMPEDTTTFKVGSITKQVTGFAILDMVDRKLLQLDDPVAKFFPEVDSRIFTEDGRSVTIQDLLTHRSGLPDVSGLAYHWGSPVRFSYFLKCLEWISDRNRPGAVHQYSNFNFLMLGEIIKRVSGQPFDEYVKEQYFTTLGMASTGMTFQDPSRRAYGHNTIHGKLFPSDEVNDFHIHGTYDWPQASDGGLVSTVSDMKIWVDYLSSRKQGDFARYASLWSERGYFAGLVNIGTEQKPVYWHNGALSPIGYTADLVFDREGHRIIVLGNVNTGEQIPNLANHIYRFLEKGSPLPDLPSFHSQSALMSLILSRIKFGLLMSAVCMLLLFRKRNQPNFALTTYGYFSSGILANSFGIQKFESLLALAAMAVFWLFILWRRQAPHERDSLSIKSFIGPTLSLIAGLLLIHSRL